MKALKSKLASQLLADPRASNQLREFLLSKPAGTVNPNAAATGKFVVRGDRGRTLQVQATVVPKAAKVA
jgi:hypothetical protein